jgi:hypothetical protein
MHQMGHRLTGECSNVRKRPPRASAGGQSLRWRLHVKAPYEISWIVKSTKRQKKKNEHILNNREIF